MTDISHAKRNEVRRRQRLTGQGYVAALRDIDAGLHGHRRIDWPVAGDMIEGLRSYAPLLDRLSPRWQIGARNGQVEGLYLYEHEPTPGDLSIGYASFLPNTWLESSTPSLEEVIDEMTFGIGLSSLDVDTEPWSTVVAVDVDYVARRPVQIKPTHPAIRTEKSGLHDDSYYVVRPGRTPAEFIDDTAALCAFCEQGILAKHRARGITGRARRA